MEKNYENLSCEPAHRVEIATEEPGIFSGLLQAGVEVEAELGRPLRELLTEGLGIEADYVEHRLQTLFLNGHPVDDLDASRATSGDVLALSTAMPGLMGATMRRAGAFSSLRSGISHNPAARTPEEGRGTVTVKLFNFTSRELAGALLSRGVLVASGALGAFLDKRSAAFFQRISRAAFDGRPLDDPTELPRRLKAGPDRVLLVLV